MARYVYECRECGARTEKVRRMSNMDNPVVCGTCTPEQKRDVPTLMERVAIPGTARPRFKGAGFYETDYVNPDKPWRALGDQPPEHDYDTF